MFLQGLVLAVLLVGPQMPLGDPSDDDPADRSGVASADASLPNLVEYDDRVLVGGVPGGESAFERLAEAGVRTIVSVDGAVPDLDAARRWGMRYVHLPIGYRGIDPGRRVELARAVLDGRNDGVVYLHCHHGKHRCAAAAATALIALGDLTPDRGVALMRRSGTSPHYPGLFRVVREGIVLDRPVIDAVPTPQSAVERPEGIVESMVAAEEAMHRLSQVADAGWRVPEHHPDLEPMVDASIVTDAMRLMLEVESTRTDGDADLVRLARRSVDTALRLETLLETRDSTDEVRRDVLSRLSSSCTECHRAHRGGYRPPASAKSGTPRPKVQAP